MKTAHVNHEAKTQKATTMCLTQRSEAVKVIEPQCAHQIFIEKGNPEKTHQFMKKSPDGSTVVGEISGSELSPYGDS